MNLIFTPNKGCGNLKCRGLPILVLLELHLFGGFVKKYTLNSVFSVINYILSCSMVVVNWPCHITNTKCKLDIVCHSFSKNLLDKVDVQCCNYYHFIIKIEISIMLDGNTLQKC